MNSGLFHVWAKSVPCAIFSKFSLGIGLDKHMLLANKHRQDLRTTYAAIAMSVDQVR